LAMPSVQKRRQREIVAGLESLQCEILTTPGYGELIGRGDPVSRIKSVSSDDLLGRNIVDLDVPDVANAYSGRSVMITGAGGSIGSELCRQVLSCNPRRIVLFDLSEFALYTIDREIRPLATETGVDVATMLGSVCDRARLRSVMQQHGVEIVVHAAAYKHVPLVEENEIEGVRNNVFGTRTLAELARELAIERFILISTDKAVRPTNVMGGTKRLAEIMIQDLQSRSPDTKFAMVGFGNVLGSSGSVIPLFSSQIAAGGPVTLTHPDVTRYFMTISEAARLVLLAGAYATGGDLFVLDMGEPVRIADLARRMVELSGLTVRDTDNPDGDIEIRTIGLRPGEKLFEELLIDNVVLQTPHPKIMRAEEACPSQLEVAALLQEMRQAVESSSAAAIRRQIGRCVEGYPAEPVMSPVIPS
ncbi:MAG TPA: nucleoside-diphosphate sugar epimerase/dehydratase, partial [Paracoccaceae bacterium]|nr:nucleoside-diphosphate sugar epimerase/dehydratase [Paracoccaceae bacterium]